MFWPSCVLLGPVMLIWPWAHVYRMIEADANAPKSKSTPLTPSPKVKERMKPISGDAFKNLLKRAISTPPAPKPAPKST